jgi:heme-degrading monooxygenase HmoA
MYCMIAHNQIKPGKVEATAKVLEKQFAPIWKKTPGFRSAHVVAGPKGEYTAFILWDNRAAAEAYANNPGRKTALSGSVDVFAVPMSAEFGEVIFSDKA